MSICSLMLARNEAPIIGMTARAALRWSDHLVILDHCSTDETLTIAGEVATEHPGRVTILHESNPVWNEMEYRQRMLNWARAAGCTHICTVDADEILTASLIPRIRGIIEQTNDSQVLQLPWVCLARGLDRYYTAGRWFNNWVSFSFRDHPDYFWSNKDRGGYEFHHRNPMGRPASFRQFPHQNADPALHQGGLMHLQFVDETKLKFKQFHYQLTEKLRWLNMPTPLGLNTVDAIRQRYQPAVHESDPAKLSTSICPREWWAGYEDLLKHCRFDKESWYIREVYSILSDHPGIAEGLDTFGLPLPSFA